MRVLEEIFKNALYYSDKGNISVNLSDREKEIEINIKDTGKGIDKKYQKEIFESFRQLGNILTDKPPGMGLGLPISRLIIEHYNGKIWVESEIGKGSCFNFTLPGILY